MRTEAIIIINIAATLFYLSNGFTPKTVCIALGTLVWNIVVLILFGKKNLHPVLVILLSGLTTAVWVQQPVGILLSVMPVVLILFGGIKGYSDNIFVIGRGARGALIGYVMIIYMVKISVCGFDLQETGLVAISATMISILGINFRRNAISIRKALAREKVTSTHDKLTGLLSRQTMESAVAEAAKKIDNFAVIMIDIDKFKDVNDTYGHSNGDLILKDLAQAIKNNIRSTDSAFRYGGDEFLVLCPGTNDSDAKTVAERIRQTFSSVVYHFDGGIQQFHISLGIAECSYDEFESTTDVIKKADQALYQSKQAGRDTISVFQNI